MLFHVSWDEHRGTLLRGPSFSPTPVSQGQFVELETEEVASGCLMSMFVNLELTEGTVGWVDNEELCSCCSAMLLASEGL